MIESKVDRLAEKIDQIVRAAQRLVRVECDEVDLTMPQMFLLRMLDVHGPMPLSDLRRHANVAQSTMSELVARLARAGYVQKRPDPVDRRSVKVAVTANGRAILKARMAQMRKRHKAVLEALSHDDQERFLGAFDTILTLLERAAHNVAPGDDDEA